nr:transposase [Dissulfuribacter thermophilus]
MCPAEKHLYVKNKNFVTRNGYKAIAFMGKKTECRVCKLRERCLRYPDRTEARQVHFFYGKENSAGSTFIEKMKRKIDSSLGRLIYSRRIGTGELVFAHICSVLGLNRFTLRGKRKVNTQWLLYCIVHNIVKIHRFAPGFT